MLWQQNLFLRYSEQFSYTARTKGLNVGRFNHKGLFQPVEVIVYSGDILLNSLISRESISEGVTCR